VCKLILLQATSVCFLESTNTFRCTFYILSLTSNKVELDFKAIAIHWSFVVAEREKAFHVTK